MSIIKTKTGMYALAVFLIITGILLDTSASVISQSLHHLSFIMGGVAIGFGIRKE